MGPGKSLKWYQKMPVEHAVMLGNSANFSVPGSGKTWMGYSTFFKLKHKEKKIDKLLIVAPLAAFRPWETEYEIMTGDTTPKIIRMSGARRDRRYLVNRTISHYEVFLVTHHTAANDADYLIKLMKKSRFMMIVDESHNIKKHDGKHASALHKVAPYAKSRMVLTGTPMPKDLHDLWSQFTFLYPDNSVLPTWNEYEWRCKSPDALETIAKDAQPYFVRISKDMLSLPEPVFNPANAGGMPTIVPMNPVQRRIYDAIAMKIRDKVEGFSDDAVALAKFRKGAMLYLIEAATDPSLLTKDTTYPSNDVDPEGLGILELLEQYPLLKNEMPKKLEMAKNLASDTLDAGEKVIIWCSFINTIEKMSTYMKNAGYHPVEIWATIPPDGKSDSNTIKENRIEEFKTDSTCNVLIANPSSLAESVSLHKQCHHAIYVDRTFNGAHYMQSLDRIHRIGLEPETLTKYDILQSERSIDQIIHERLICKQEAMERFLRQDTLQIHEIYDEEATVDGFDDKDEDDFNAVIEDIRRQVKNI